MSQKHQCDRCGLLANSGDGDIPFDWECFRLGKGIDQSTRDLCSTCLQSFWDWFQQGSKK